MMIDSQLDPSDKGRVSLHLKSRTERNPTIAILCMDFNQNLWEWHRHLKHRGVDTSRSLWRPMTIEEYQRESKYMRLHSYGYRTWIDLIRDEWVNTNDTDWCLEIIKLAKVKLSLEQIIKQD